MTEHFAFRGHRPENPFPMPFGKREPGHVDPMFGLQEASPGEFRRKEAAVMVTASAEGQSTVTAVLVRAGAFEAARPTVSHSWQLMLVEDGSFAAVLPDSMSPAEVQAVLHVMTRYHVMAEKVAADSYEEGRADAQKSIRAALGL